MSRCLYYQCSQHLNYQLPSKAVHRIPTTTTCPINEKTVKSSPISKSSEEQINERGVGQASTQPKFVLSLNILVSFIKPTEYILAPCRDGGVGYTMLPQLPFIIAS